MMHVPNMSRSQIGKLGFIMRLFREWEKKWGKRYVEALYSPGASEDMRRELNEILERVGCPLCGERVWLEPVRTCLEFDENGECVRSVVDLIYLRCSCGFKREVFFYW